MNLALPCSDNDDIGYAPVLVSLGQSHGCWLRTGIAMEESDGVMGREEECSSVSQSFYGFFVPKQDFGATVSGH